MSSKQLKMDISGEECVTIMNLGISEHDEIYVLRRDLVFVAQALSNELGITDLLKLRDHVEQKIKEIYSVKEG